MRKSPNQRTQEDVTAIQAYLMTIPFLRDSFQGQEQSFELLSKLFRLEIFEENKTIFHIDSKGEKYYMILQGTVGIFIRPAKQMGKSIKKQKQQKKKEEEGSNQNDSSNKHQQDEKSKDWYDWQISQNSHLQSLMLVKNLQEGQTFGEMALIYNQPRLATAHTLSETILAVLTKRDFRLIMKKAEMRQIKGELKFLKQVYLFQSWSYEMLRDIYLNSEQIQIQHGQNVFKEDDPADSLYIIKKGSFLIGQLGEYDVFGEEEFLQLINLIFRNNEDNENSYFDLSDQVLEQFIVNNQSTKRFSTVVCDSREGGTLIRIKINDFILRVLNYSETRKIVISQIEQKISLHSLMHQKNCETFVAYQKYLVKGDAALYTNPLNALVCQNIVYQKGINKNENNGFTHQAPNSGRQRGNSPFDSSTTATETLFKTKDKFKPNNTELNKSYDWASSQTNNQQKASLSTAFSSNNTKQLKGRQPINLKEKVNGERPNSPEQNKSETMQTESQRRNFKSYKIQFSSEQCDDSIFDDNVPLNVKQIHNERKQQRQEAIQIFQFQQSKMEKIQLKIFNDKYRQNSPKSQSSKSNYKTIENSIAQRIAKLGYRVVRPKEGSEEKGEQSTISDNLSNGLSIYPDRDNTLMQITSCGDQWVNTSIDQPLQGYLNKSYKSNTKQMNNIFLDKQPDELWKPQSFSPKRDKIPIQLKPLTNIKQNNSISKKKNDQEKFDIFYSGIPKYSSNQSQRNSIQYDKQTNPFSISPKTKVLQSLNSTRYDPNKTQDIYHPLNYYERSMSNSGRSIEQPPSSLNCNNKLINQVLTYYKSRSNSSNKNRLINCSSLIPQQTITTITTPQTYQQNTSYNSSLNKIIQKNKLNNKILQQKVILESV